MDHTAPLFGVPPTMRALLAGDPLYGESVHRDLYAYLALTWPTLVIDDRLGLYRSVGDSWPMAEFLQGAWTAAARLLDASRAGRPRRGATRAFHTQLATMRAELGRLLEKRPAVDLDLDFSCGAADPLDELHGRLTFYCAGLGDGAATQDLIGLAWQAVRDAGPGDDDMPDLYATAVGATLLKGDVRVRWRPDPDVTDVVGQWREHGRVALRGAVPPAAPMQTVSSLHEILNRRPEPVDDGPSLLVLASVDHLPGTAKAGDGKPGSTGTTARAEGAPIAGRWLPLVAVPDLARVKRRLVAEFPDCERIIDAILAPLAGRSFAWLSPILLRGAPGSGKSRLARRIGEELGLAVTVYGCGAVADGAFIGTSRQWSTGRACVPLQAIKRAGAASVLLILDEISRAGTRTDNGRLTDGVLALLERETARAFHDPYLECAVDLSAVSYIATANDTTDLDPALLSRFRVLDMPRPTVASLPVLARSLVADVRRERGLDERWLGDLSPAELDMVAEHWRGGSVRTLQALIECALDGRHAGLAN
jgi:ATP-dependent Lon protease